MIRRAQKSAAAIAVVALGLISCSQAEPTPAPPSDAATLIGRVIEAMDGVSFESTMVEEWTSLDRGTGQYNSGSLTTTTLYGEDGSYRQAIEGNSTRSPNPYMRQSVCINGVMFQKYFDEEWTEAENPGGCTFDANSPHIRQFDYDWTTGPEYFPTDEGMVLRLLGERFGPARSGVTLDAGTFVITTAEIWVDPKTHRMVRFESSAETFATEAAWGVIPDRREPISTFTTSTSYSSYGEAVVVEAPRNTGVLN